MIKKLLILPILGLVGLTSLSYAYTVDGFTSDSDISVYNFSNSSEIYDEFAGNGNFICISSSDNPYYLSMSAFENSTPEFTYINSSVKCFSDNSLLSYSDYSMYIYSDIDDYTEKEISGKIYYSVSPITYSSSSDSSDSNGIITIPSNFVSGLTSLLNNFGSTIANWLPTIILLGLGIVAVFALFRVVRNYSRKAFKG